MTIGGALNELNNLLNADDIPCYYKPSIKAVMDTIALEQEPTLSIDDVMSVFDDFMCGEVDEEGTESFLEMLKDKAESEKEEPKSEWEQDHEILKAYSDGANEVLDKIRAEIKQRPYGIANDSVIQGMKYERAAILEIIDKYKGESEG